MEPPAAAIAPGTALLMHLPPQSSLTCAAAPAPGRTHLLVQAGLGRGATRVLAGQEPQGVPGQGGQGGTEQVGADGAAWRVGVGHLQVGVVVAHLRGCWLGSRGVPQLGGRPAVR